MSQKVTTIVPRARCFPKRRLRPCFTPLGFSVFFVRYPGVRHPGLQCVAPSGLTADCRLPIADCQIELTTFCDTLRGETNPHFESLAVDLRNVRRGGHEEPLDGVNNFLDTGELAQEGATNRWSRH